MRRCTPIAVLALAALVACTPAPVTSGKGTGTGTDSTSGTDGTTGPGACVPGQSIQCWCSDGSSGAQVCLANGTYGACSCSGSTDTTDVTDTTDTTDIPDTGPTPDEGTPPPDEGTPPPDPGKPDPGTPPSCDSPTFSPFSAHITTASLPTEPELFACDANGDGLVGEADGNFNKFAALLKTASVDLDGALKSTIENRAEILLLELAGYGGGDASGFSVNMLYGVDLAAQPDPTCQDLLGGACTWGIAQASLDEKTCQRLVEFPDAESKSSALSAGPGDFSLDVPLDDGAALPLLFSGGRIAGVTSGQLTISDGRLCGRFPRKVFLDGIKALCEGPPPEPTICGVEVILPSLLTCEVDACVGGSCQKDAAVQCVEDTDCTAWCSWVMSFQAVPVSGIVLGE